LEEFGLESRQVALSTGVGEPDRPLADLVTDDS
jgi:hypothetical protein